MTNVSLNQINSKQTNSDKTSNGQVKTGISLRSVAKRLTLLMNWFTM